MRKYLYIFCVAVLFAACNKNSKDFDANGNLLVEHLNSADGALNFTPMQTSDTDDVLNYTPSIFTYQNKPYTGKFAAYSKDKLAVEGNLKEGMFSGDWKFYYASGVVQVEGTYAKGHEVGFWNSYFKKDKYNIVKYYSADGYMLMRKEYYNNGKIKNYQNVNCPEFGNRERRIQFKNNGEIDYIDAEREIGKLTPAEINNMLQNNDLLIQ